MKDFLQISIFNTFERLQYPKGFLLRMKKKAEEIKKRSVEEKKKRKQEQQKTRSLHIDTAIEACRYDFEAAAFRRLQCGHRIRQKNRRFGSSEASKGRKQKRGIQNSLFWSMQQILHR